jgi:diguanylate cyclase (GGDEF)-like protein
LDHFKRINDAWGHPTGDGVLTHVARLLAAGVRAGDTVCRVGGEEFAILCPHTRPEEGLALAERLCRTVADTPAVVGGRRLALTTSFGVAGLLPGEAPQALVAAADAALYEAKRRGRNRVEVARRTLPEGGGPTGTTPRAGSPCLA